MKAERITDFNRGQSSKIFRRIVETGDPVVVTNHNDALVVIISAKEYISLTNRSLQVDIPIWGE